MELRNAGRGGAEYFVASNEGEVDRNHNMSAVWRGDIYSPPCDMSNTKNTFF
jgi:hypothetical protein